MSFRPGAREPPCLSVPALFGCSRFHGAIQGANKKGPQGGAVLGGEEAACPRELLASQSPSSSAWLAALQPWPLLARGPFGWFTRVHRGLSQLLHSLPANRSSCLGTPATSLGCSQDSQSPPILLAGPLQGRTPCPCVSPALNTHLALEITAKQFSSTSWASCSSAPF